MSNRGTIGEALGVGFLGQGEEGRFHLEQFRLRSECHCAAVWFVPGHNARGNASRLVSRVAESPDEIAHDPLIELVVIDSEALGGAKANAFAVECLRGGKHVCLGFQAFLNHPQSLPELGLIAANAERQVLIPMRHRWESSFLGVRSVISAGKLGQLRRICHLSRQFVPAELAGTRNLGADFQQALNRLWFQMLDELLEFVPDSATVFSSQKEWHPHQNHQQTEPNDAADTTAATLCGRTAELVFDNGCSAHLELSRRSLAPIDTGWILEGLNGGFSDRKWYQATPQYELVDIPVEFPSTNQQGFYDAIFATVRHGKPYPVTLDSIQKVLELWQEIDRISGQRD